MSSKCWDVVVDVPVVVVVNELDGRGVVGSSVVAGATPAPLSWESLEPLHDVRVCREIERAVATRLTWRDGCRVAQVVRWRTLSNTSSATPTAGVIFFVVMRNSWIG